MKRILCNNRYFRLFWQSVILLGLALGSLPTRAFSDIYEPDDDPQQATVIAVGDQTRHQHTLHLNQDGKTDVDWFEFYALKDTLYGVHVDPVGTDIDIKFVLSDQAGLMEPKVVNNNFKGEKEYLTWSAPHEGIYYLTVSDVAKPASCRSEIQYELRIVRPIAGDSAPVEGSVRDAISGNPLKEVVISVNCNASVLSDIAGKYSLSYNCPAGLYELTAKAKGYQTSSCQIPTTAIVPVPRNIALFPVDAIVPPPSPGQLAFHNGDTLKPAQQGEKLQVEFDLHGLTNEICAFYYIGILYPDHHFYMITKRITESSQLIEVDLSNPPPLRHWEDIGNVVIDMPTDNLPRGTYTLYLLRMPASVEEPLKHLEMGGLNSVNFEIQ